jgi:hypothetical protein
MDPIGTQKKIKSDSYRYAFQKKVDGGGSCKDGGFNKSSGTRSSEGGKLESRWQGTTKGKTTHKK